MKSSREDLLYRNLMLSYVMVIVDQIGDFIGSRPGLVEEDSRRKLRQYSTSLDSSTFGLIDRF